MFQSCVDDCKKKRESWRQDNRWTDVLSKTNMSSKKNPSFVRSLKTQMTTGGVIDAILMDEEHSEDDSDTDETRQIQTAMKHKAINRLSCKS